MLVSHPYRFIFSKPRKTARSSVEVALSRALEPGDVATSLARDDEPLREVKPGVDVRSGWYWPRSRLGRPYRLRNHSSLEKIYRVFGPAVQRYRVVSMTRNPWDRAVSRFFYDMRRTSIREQDPSVQKAAFIRFTRFYGPRTWLDSFYGRKKERALDNGRVLYFIDGRCRADYILRFEFLEQNLYGLQDFLGLPEVPNVEGIRLKTGTRPATKKHKWVDFYDNETQALVAECCRWEIEQSGYDFEGQKTPSSPFLNIEPHRSRAA